MPARPSLLASCQRRPRTFRKVELVELLEGDLVLERLQQSRYASKDARYQSDYDASEAKRPVKLAPNSPESSSSDDSGGKGSKGKDVKGEAKELAAVSEAAQLARITGTDPVTEGMRQAGLIGFTSFAANHMNSVAAQQFYKPTLVPFMDIKPESSDNQYQRLQYEHDTLLDSGLLKRSFFDDWSPQEVALFECGLLCYGKAFHNISRLIRTKNTCDCVEFYYHWKVTSHYHLWKKMKKPKELVAFQPCKEDQWIAIWEKVMYEPERLATAAQQVEPVLDAAAMDTTADVEPPVATKPVESPQVFLDPVMRFKIPDVELKSKLRQHMLLRNESFEAQFRHIERNDAPDAVSTLRPPPEIVDRRQLWTTGIKPRVSAETAVAAATYVGGHSLAEVNKALTKITGNKIDTINIITTGRKRKKLIDVVQWDDVVTGSAKKKRRKKPTPSPAKPATVSS